MSLEKTLSAVTIINLIAQQLSSPEPIDTSKKIQDELSGLGETPKREFFPKSIEELTKIEPEIDIRRQKAVAPERQTFSIPEPILVIIDKNHPVDQEYLTVQVEPDLVVISQVSKNIQVLNEKTRIHEICLSDLENLFIASHEAGVSLYVRSGYRSIEDQKIAFSKATDKKVVAIPGTTQHHSGLAIDFTTPEIGNVVDIRSNFSQTKAGKWLSENAWRFGFVPPYTQGHDGIANEDWHYYYAGKELAELWYQAQQKSDKTDLFSLIDQINLGRIP